MPLAGQMRDRITLERFTEGANNVGHSWTPVATVWTATEPQGDARYRFTIWYRADLPSKRTDLQPAMRAIYDGDEYVIDDAIESVRRTEVQLLAHREMVEEIAHLRTGTNRIKSA